MTNLPPIEELIPSIDPENPPLEAWKLAQEIAAISKDEDEARSDT
jgi:hypothetical protein